MAAPRFPVDTGDTPEPDPFHPNGEAIEDDPLVLARYAHDCWVAGVDPRELGRYLRGEE